MDAVFRPETRVHLLLFKIHLKRNGTHRKISNILVNNLHYENAYSPVWVVRGVQSSVYCEGRIWCVISTWCQMLRGPLWEDLDHGHCPAAPWPPLNWPFLQELEGTAIATGRANTRSLPIPFVNCWDTDLQACTSDHEYPDLTVKVS